MRTLEDYVALVTSEHRNQPKFTETLRQTLAPVVAYRDMTAGITRAFDLDTAIGVQLDVDGEWIGRSRMIPEPLPNLWFSFDTLHKGFDQGYWKGPFDVDEMLERLDDDTFRRLLRAKILANNWDGEISTAQAALDTFFTTEANPGTYILVDDEADVATTRSFFSFDITGRGFDSPSVWWQSGLIISTLPSMNMRVTVAVAGKIPPIVDLEIFAQNLIPLSIGGVDQEVKVVSVDNAQMFGFDIDNQYLGGFESGAWGVSPQYLVDLIENDIPWPSLEEIVIEVITPPPPPPPGTGPRELKFDTPRNSMYAFV